MVHPGGPERHPCPEESHSECHSNNVSNAVIITQVLQDVYKLFMSLICTFIAEVPLLVTFSLYMQIYIYIYIPYIYIYIFMYVCMCVYVCIHLCMYMYMCIICICICICI